MAWNVEDSLLRFQNVFLSVSIQETFGTEIYFLLYSNILIVNIYIVISVTVRYLIEAKKINAIPVTGRGGL
jgi:hypothetical protein